MSQNKKYYFFEAYDISNGECLGAIKIYLGIHTLDIFVDPFDDVFYDMVYNTDIKVELYDSCPNIMYKLNEVVGKDIMADDSIGVHMITSLEYRKYDVSYDNECKFVEYIISEKARNDKKTIIDKELLENNGFEPNILSLGYLSLTTEKYDDKDYIKLDIVNDFTNNEAQWHLHIDNNRCETIGSADIDNVWQFNTLMEVFGSKFRL